jgi:trans-aconitate 2-methyltransferase
MHNWSPAQYLAFEDERTRPVRDLLAAVPTAVVRRVVDIGCGPGNSTEVLAARFPAAEVSGIDSSPEMVDAARRRLPAVAFALADIREWPDPGPYDVILANAVFQWLPDHEGLLPSLAARLAPGGSLCVQMPDNLDEPALRAIREIAADGPWAEQLRGVDQTRTPIGSAAWYYGVLHRHVSRVDVWRTTYHHRLADPRAVVEWFRGSALRPYLEPLATEAREAFLERYTRAIEAVCPTLSGGGVLLPFPRLFIVATR